MSVLTQAITVCLRHIAAVVAQLFTRPLKLAFRKPHVRQSSNARSNPVVLQIIVSNQMEGPGEILGPACTCHYGQEYYASEIVYWAAFDVEGARFQKGVVISQLLRGHILHSTKFCRYFSSMQNGFGGSLLCGRLPPSSCGLSRSMLRAVCINGGATQRLLQVDCQESLGQ